MAKWVSAMLGWLLGVALPLGMPTLPSGTGQLAAVVLGLLVMAAVVRAEAGGGWVFVESGQARSSRAGASPSVRLGAGQVLVWSAAVPAAALTASSLQAIGGGDIASIYSGVSIQQAQLDAQGTTDIGATSSEDINSVTVSAAGGGVGVAGAAAYLLSSKKLQADAPAPETLDDLEARVLHCALQRDRKSVV